MSRYKAYGTFKQVQLEEITPRMKKEMQLKDKLLQLKRISEESKRYVQKLENLEEKIEAIQSNKPITSTTQEMEVALEGRGAMVSSYNQELEKITLVIKQMAVDAKTLNTEIQHLREELETTPSYQYETVSFNN